jgi:MarR family transcriptional regulator, temperature-dependent positive regulator of motility
MKNRDAKPGLFLEPFVLSQLVGSVIAKVVEGSGLGGKDFAVASSLAVWSEATPSELASLLGMAPTTMSSVLGRLERRGLVERLRDPRDGRRYVLRLTDEGMRLRDAAIKRFPEWLDRVRAHLGDDPDEVLEPMRRLERALRAALEE